MQDRIFDVIEQMGYLGVAGLMLLAILFPHLSFSHFLVLYAHQQRWMSHKAWRS